MLQEQCTNTRRMIHDFSIVIISKFVVLARRCVNLFSNACSFFKVVDTKFNIERTTDNGNGKCRE